MTKLTRKTAEKLHKQLWNRVIKILEERRFDQEHPTIASIKRLALSELGVEEKDRPIYDCYFCELCKSKLSNHYSICGQCAYFKTKCNEINSLWSQIYLSMNYGYLRKTISLAKQIRDAKPDPRNLR